MPKFAIEREGETGEEPTESEGRESNEREWTTPATDPGSADEPSRESAALDSSAVSTAASIRGSPETGVDRERETPELGDQGEEFPSSHTDEREFECLECNATSTDFLRRCPNCGGRAFRTEGDAGGESGVVDRTVGWVARITAPINPYVPR